MVSKVHLVVLVHGEDSSTLLRRRGPNRADSLSSSFSSSSSSLACSSSGLWGNPSHVENLGAEVLAAHPFSNGKLAESGKGNGHAGSEEGGEEAEVVVLNTTGNSADKT